MSSNCLILCHPLLLLPSIFPSIRVLSNESVLHIRWPKYWRFSFCISPPRNIQDWFPLGLTGWISLPSKGLSSVFSNTTVQKHQFFRFDYSSVQFSCSVTSDSLQPHGLQHARLPCPSPTPGACSNSCPLSWWWTTHLILHRPLFFLPSIFPSIRVFSIESVLHIRWPKYWSFSFSISPSNEYSGLISFRMDWLHLLAPQGTLQESSPTPQFKNTNSSRLSFL